MTKQYSLALERLLDDEPRAQYRGKLIYVSPNIPTACPPCAAGPANRGRGFASLFLLSTPGSLAVSFAFDTQLVNRAMRPIAIGCHKYRFRRNSTQLEMIEIFKCDLM